MLSLFAAPIAGKWWYGDDPDGVPVTIIGLERTPADTEPFALMIDADAIPHRAPWSQVDFTSAAPGATPATITASLGA